MVQDIQKFALRRGFSVLGLAITGSLFLALPGAAQVNAPVVDCEIPPPGTPSGTISYEDRQNILDLIANFSRVFNEPGASPEQRRAQLEAMFASQFKYQVCSSELQGFVTEDRKELFDGIEDIYKSLETQYSQSAHFVTNIVLTPTAPDIVEESSLMLLVLTPDEDPEHPVIDYTAIVRGIFQKSPATGQWQFKSRAFIRGTSGVSYAR